MNKPNSSLSQFIEEYPLYSKFGIDQPIEAADLDNLAFNFFCKSEKEMQPFRLARSNEHLTYAENSSPDILSSVNGLRGFTELFSGICQSCGNYQINVVINATSQKESPKYFIRKIGQYPAPQNEMTRLSAEIAGFLNGQNRDYYIKALDCLDREYGTAALGYLKKVMKSEMERIIETVANPYSTEGDKIVGAFTSYRRNPQRTKFIEEVTPHLPKNLANHGAHILLVLHDMQTIDIDAMTENDCMKKSKDIDSLFRYLIRRIYTDLHESTAQKAGNKYFLRYT